ncbi:hypothetical protein ACT2CC_00220 [Candidatus Vidania fulgoroideorum]
MFKYNIFKRKNFFIENRNYNCLRIIKEKKNFIIFDKYKKATFYPEENNNKKNIISCIYNVVGEKIFNVKKCGIVSRLDLETKGIFLLLKKNCKFKIIKKRYLVISNKYNEVDISFSLKGYLKKIKDKVYFIRNKKNKNQVFTKFNIKSIKKNEIIIICEFLRAKTHQIRSSLKYLSIKILGDRKYGICSSKYYESNLHSWNLIFKIKNKTYNYYSIPNKIFIKYFRQIKFSKFYI